MNGITSRIVEEVARHHPSDAKKNGERFAALVEDAYWNELMVTNGVDRWLELMEGLRKKRPALFDGEGFLILEDQAAQVEEERISREVGDYLEQLSERPDLRLEDWGAVPEEIAEPQMALPLFSDVPAKTDKVLAAVV